MRVKRKGQTPGEQLSRRIKSRVERRKGSCALEFLAVALPMEKESKILNIKL